MIDIRPRAHFPAWTTTCVLVATCLAQPLPAHAEAPNWPKTFPVVGMERYTENTCTSWLSEGVATAQPFAAEVMASWGLEQYLSFGGDPSSDLPHLHVNEDGSVILSFELVKYIKFEDAQPWLRARQINRVFFGVDDPPVGTKVRVSSGHKGACAASQNKRERWGLALSNSRWDYKFVPHDGAVTVPDTKHYCLFDSTTGSLTFYHGSMRVGSTSMVSLPVTIKCIGDTKYTLKARGMPADVSLKVGDKDLDANGVLLETIGNQAGTQGIRRVSLSSIITPKEAGNFRRSAVVEINVQ